MVELKNVKFGYRKSELLFNDISLHFEKGRIYGLLGKNGSGKTSMIHLILGMNKLDEGECLIDGVSSIKRVADILEDVYFQPEDIYIPSVSGKKYLKMYSGFYKKFDSDLFETLSQEMELILDRKLKSLSTGEKKKFFIAFGLATRCNYLFFDEPTNGLDIPAKGIFRKVVASSVTDSQVVVILTHQVLDVENLIDSMVIIENGKIYFDGFVNEITDNYVIKTLDSIDDSDKIVYYEQFPSGYAAVMRGKPGIDGRLLDLETLFKTVVFGKNDFYNGGNV